MLLDRIDIDAHGPLHRVELGPLAEHLNVVLGPDGAGKTAIGRFIRDALVERHYPLGMMSSSTGRVVWADQHGMVHCRREQDGTPAGRRTIEYECRGEYPLRFDSLNHSWISGAADTTDASLSLKSIQLPEPIVDGVITDTAVTSVARVVRSCIRAGLDSPDAYRWLPLAHASEAPGREPASDRRQPGGFQTPSPAWNAGNSEPNEHTLRARLADVEAELAGFNVETVDYDELVTLRHQLEMQLASPSFRDALPPKDADSQPGRSISELHDRLNRLRSRQAALHRWIDRLDEQVAAGRALDPCDDAPAQRAPSAEERSTESLSGEDRGASGDDQGIAGEQGQAIRDRRLDSMRERDTRLDELRIVESDLAACLNEVARRRESMMAQRRRIDDQLAFRSRVEWLRDQRQQITDQLRMSRPSTRGQSPLAAVASRWLMRLSGGRLHKIDWPSGPENATAAAATATCPHPTDVVGVTSGRDSGVRINDRSELECETATRALAAMAVRLAAGDLLARSGRAVPLVIETHRELFSDERGFTTGFAATPPQSKMASSLTQCGHDGSQHPVAAALFEYATAGRQVLLLTAHQPLADQLTRSGARIFRLLSRRTVHPHRPLWKPQYAPENYVGPHPHTYGYAAPGGFETPSGFKTAGGEAAAPWQRGGGNTNPAVRNGSTIATSATDINRDFDAAWREAYGLHGASHRSHHDGVSKTRPAAGMSGYPDGYYFSDSYTTIDHHEPHAGCPQDQWLNAGVSAGPRQQADDGVERRESRADAPENPFFLTVDSPIDQAPSIDAVAAARLRGLAITHINHLMQQDSNRLSDTLGLANVNAACVRRWQHECRLVCRVPQLRGFDARLLVGCGITDPAHLAAIHPADLLERVQSFLATERGQRILLSGSSYELSRITSWIASANCGAKNGSGAIVDGKRVSARVVRDETTRGAREEGAREDSAREDSAREEGSREDVTPFGAVPRRRSAGQNAAGHDAASVRSRHAPSSSASAASAGRSRSAAPSRSGSSHPANGSDRSDRSNSVSAASDLMHSGDSDRERVRLRQHESPQRNGLGRSERGTETSALRFNLDCDSDIVDAPSIGPRMAERLNAVGVFTVDDLLAADPPALAEELDHQRVDAETVVQWQQQAELVCRVPMLRGHDAQLLVAVGVTTAEELAASDAQSLLTDIEPFTHSREGKRILRGGKWPDLVEISDWIDHSQQHRPPLAA